jgi:agmatinase
MVGESPRGIPTLVGVPYDRGSSYLRGAALAPSRIRDALGCASSNLSTEDGQALDGGLVWRDAGDIECGAGDVHGAIERRVSQVIAEGGRPLVLGGDHSITFPVVRAVAAAIPSLTILHFDAHADLYDTLDGDRYSHACPFARIMEEGLVRRLVQVGIRTLTRHQREQAARFGVEIIDMRALAAGARPDVSGPVYVSLDLDVLDPAFAPGVSHWEPGGLSTRELLTMLQAIAAPLVGADLVEYNPQRDPTGMTAMVAAKLLKELLAQFAPSRSAAGRGAG